MFRDKYAQRTHQPIDPIEDVFEQTERLNLEREKNNLQPIIKLSIGQPHLGAHAQMIEQLGKYLQDAPEPLVFPYEPVAGKPEVLQAICELYQSYYPSIRFSTDEVMISNGATQALFNALSILVDPGNYVLLIEPYYSAYRTLIHTLGGRVLNVPTADNDFQLTANALEKQLLAFPGIKALILNYPNNPSGVDLTYQELKELSAVLANFPELTLIIDDVYGELTEQTHSTILEINPELKPRTILINSASKSFAVPGLRIGMTAAPAEMIHLMVQQQSHATCTISSLTAQALICAANIKLNPQYQFSTWLGHCKAVYNKNRMLVVEKLSQSGFEFIENSNGMFVLVKANFMLNRHIPDSVMLINNSGGAYLLDKLHHRIGSALFQTDKHIAQYFLLVAGVAVIHGSAFGIDESCAYLRISCAIDYDRMDKALTLLTQSLTAIPMLNEDCETYQASAFHEANTPHFNSCSKPLYGMFKTISVRKQDSEWASNSEDAILQPTASSFKL